MSRFGDLISGTSVPEPIPPKPPVTPTVKATVEPTVKKSVAAPKKLNAHKKLKKEKPRATNSIGNWKM